MPAGTVPVPGPVGLGQGKRVPVPFAVPCPVPFRYHHYCFIMENLTSTNLRQIRAWTFHLTASDNFA